MPCSQGKRGASGKLCPYEEHKPQTKEGWQAWDIIERAGCHIQYINAGSKLVATGIDVVAIFALADALGYDVPAIADLLIPAAESGIVEGFNRK